jgi:mxaK protein
MVKFKRKKLTFLSFFILSIVCVFLGVDSYNLLQMNKAKSRMENNNPKNDSVFFEEQFSAAEKFIDKEKFEMALAIFNNIEQSNASINLKQEALFNSANIYFNSAINALENNDEASSVPNLELGKLTYRKCLNLNPLHYGARYNLERALLIAPEKNFEKKNNSMRPERGESAVTTMKLQAQGMP